MQGGSIDTGVAADLPTLQAISGGLKIKLGTVANAATYAQVFVKQNGVSPSVATVVVSQGATALLPVSPAVVASVQDVADLMHQIGSLPTAVQVATAVDTSAYPTAVTG